MPRAVQTVDRFHVTRLFGKATDRVRCAGRLESERKARQLSRTKYVWLKREENLTDWFSALEYRATH